MKQKNNYTGIVNSCEPKVKIIFGSIAVGMIAGLVVIFYRYVVGVAEDICFKIYSLCTEYVWLIPIIFIALIAMGYLVGILVTRNKMIAGSGIPQVKGILHGYFKDSWLDTFLTKMIGGSISALAGLSLGREGPSIQLGACIGDGVGKKFATTRNERKMYIASGASAGLSAAFNAPLASVIFALEELFGYFSPTLLLSVMIAGVTADFVSKCFFGAAPIFQFNITNSIPLSGYWIIILLGIILGAFGTFYNKILLATQGAYQKIACFNTRTKIIIPFVFAGIFGLSFPIVLCGGHAIVEKLDITTSLSMLVIILLFKFIFSMISFGSGAPGGIFFPLLVLGAIIGTIVGKIAVQMLGFDPVLFDNFIVLAMAGYFTAIVRAPITGIILIFEMTGSFSQLLSLAVVSVIAYIVAELLKSKPVYESLLENLLKTHEIEEVDDESKKITIETVVHFHSQMDQKLVKELDLPFQCLLVAVIRNSKEFIPNGNTKLKAGDKIIVLTDLNNESVIREQINTLATFG